MARPRAFLPVKLVCGVIYGREALYDRARELLFELHGPVELESPAFAFDLTDYYEREMGPGLARRFMSFRRLVDPSRLPDIKIATNALEDRIAVEADAGARPVNIDPGYVTPSALVMATAKDFAHRIPLGRGIYAHLELLFTRTGVRCLDWTYPDMRRDGPRAFFLEVRRQCLEQLRGAA
ncbi:MAG TPA: DUF4416 family protein [Terriglobales bacterium]|nr:DUF4416 family protein [Terriglobales bacterium]